MMNLEGQSIDNPPPAPQDDEVYWEGFIEAQKAAEFLGVDPDTVRRWAEEGRIPAHPMNDRDLGDWRFLISELEHWVRQAT